MIKQYPTTLLRHYLPCGGNPLTPRAWITDTRAVMTGMGMIGVLLLSSCSDPKPPSFEASVDAHLAAIVDRDLDAYLKTITKTEALPLIFPDGSFLATRAEVEAMTKDWFANKDWRMTFEPVSKVIGSDLGVVLVKYAYQDTPDGEPRYAFLALTFQLQDGQWRLVLDQNTRITQVK